MIDAVNMAEDKVLLYLKSRSVHMMYQLTRDELHNVAGEFGVRLQGKRKEELQMELKTLLEKKIWLKREKEESDEEGEEEDKPEDF